MAIHDPVWLADIPRAEGPNVVEFPGWRGRGPGNFQEIWGVVCHAGTNLAPACTTDSRPDPPVRRKLNIRRCSTGSENLKGGRICIRATARVRDFLSEVQFK